MRLSSGTYTSCNKIAKKAISRGLPKPNHITRKSAFRYARAVKRVNKTIRKGIYD